MISSISAVHPASDFHAFIGYFTSPDLAVVTSTVTEAGYYRTDDGSLDVDNDAVAADLGIDPEDPEAHFQRAVILGSARDLATAQQALARLPAR